MTGDDNKFAKTVCPICYEDLKPTAEDLQSISICGHVFHELCLQQWFEYCSSSSNKYNCPVCKQRCQAHNAGRLYFQSLGDQCDSVCSRRPIDCEEDVDVLRGEAKRLQAKVSGLSSVVERLEKDLTKTKKELCLCLERTEQEVALKNEALREKAIIQHKLESKSEELSKSNLEGSRLEKRNMALAKEIAVLKLVSDLDLEQDEILKFASLGNEANPQDTIDNLSRSLASHKKSYKELMAKCNVLGRGEACLQKKLEKAKEKMNKLKKRIQELEMEKEVKDNEVLRALKASKKNSVKGVSLNAGEQSNSLIANNSLSENRTEQPFIPTNKSDLTGKSPYDISCSSRMKNIHAVGHMTVNHTGGCSTSVGPDGERSTLTDEPVSKFSASVHRLLSLDSQHQNGVQESALSMLEVVSHTNGEATVHGPDNVVGLSESTRSSIDAAASKPMFNIRTETPVPLKLSEQGSFCFSGGVLGPDGTKWHLGKWCKRGNTNESVAAQGSVTNTSHLITVGADGRGGRVKVMRPMTHSSSLDDNRDSVCVKRLKFGAKTSSLQSKGCLQLEHFFGKAKASY